MICFSICLYFNISCQVTSYHFFVLTCFWVFNSRLVLTVCNYFLHIITLFQLIDIYLFIFHQLFKILKLCAFLYELFPYLNKLKRKLRLYRYCVCRTVLHQSSLCFLYYYHLTISYCKVYFIIITIICYHFLKQYFWKKGKDFTNVVITCVQSHLLLFKQIKYIYTKLKKKNR